MTTLETSSASLPPVPSLQLSRDQIMQVTARCLREFGYDATTIRKIAGLLDCAVGSIYRYFLDKRDLLSAVTQQMLEPVAVMVEAGGSMEQSIRLYRQVVTHAPETYRLMFWVACPETGSPGTTACRLPTVVQKIVDAWSAQLGDAATARQCWSVLHGFILQGRDAQETLDVIKPMLPVNSAEPRIVITMTEPPKPVARVAAPVISIREAAAVDDVVML